MTLKQLLDKYCYADIASYIEMEVNKNENDRRPKNVKMDEMEQGFAYIKGLKPTFGYIDMQIDVKMLDGRLTVSNMHLGSTSDLLSHQINIGDDVTASEQEIAAQCVFQLVAHQAATTKYREDDAFDDWDNPQTASCLR